MNKISIQKPYNIQPFGNSIDASEINRISWQVSGDISVAYAIQILDNLDNTIIFNLAKTSSYSTFYQLPANSLQNGYAYKLQITIWNQADNSASSDFVVFQTSTRPSVSIDTIGTVSSPSNQFTATYLQTEDVPIKYWQVFLYDSDDNLISQSELQLSPTLSYLINNLQSEKSYSIEFKATSEKDLVGTSGKISFNVLYTTPQFSVNLTAENNNTAGVDLSWFIIRLLGESSNTPIYIDDQKIDLTADGDNVFFQEGFSIDKNFTMKVWFENIPFNKELIYIKGLNGEITINYSALYKKFIVSRKNYINNITESWNSNEVEGISYFLYIKQVNSYMDIYAEVEN